LYTYGVLGPQEKFGYIHLQTTPWCDCFFSYRCSFGLVQARLAKHQQLLSSWVKDRTTTTATPT
jgi:hypothetical protein